MTSTPDARNSKPATPRNEQPARLIVALCATAVVAALAVQSRVLSSYFSLDEWRQFFEIEQHGSTWFVFARYNQHFAPLTKLLIVGSYAAFGFNPLPYFLIMLGVHLINTALLWRFVWLETRAPLLATLLGAVWGASALQYNALDTFSSLGIEVSTLFLLVILLDLGRQRREASAPSKSRLLFWAAIMLCMSASIAMGIALAVAVPIVAALTLPPPGRRRTAAVLGVWAALLCVAFALPHSTAAYDVVVAQRLTLNAPMALAMLTSYGAAALVAGPLLSVQGYRVRIGPIEPLPRDVFLTWTAIAGGVLLAATLVACWRLPAARKRYVIALALVAMSQYASITLGRAFLLNDDKLAPVLLQQGRYHYVATLAFAGIVAVLFAQAGSRWPWRARLIAASSFLLLNTAANRAVGDHMINPGLQAGKWQFPQACAELRNALDGAPPNSVVYLPNTHFEPVHRPIVSAFPDYDTKQAFPGVAGLFVLLYASDVVGGRTVRFVESDTELVRKWRASGGLLGKLLVTEAEAR